MQLAGGERSSNATRPDQREGPLWVEIRPSHGAKFLDTVETNPVFGDEPKFPGARKSKKDLGGDAEGDVEVAGDRRSWNAVASTTDYCSQHCLVECLLRTVFGVFQRYP